MTGRLEGKVAFITGAARGQGRSHALRLAHEGADIIAVDICDSIGTVPYDGATKADLDETVRQVEALDRRIVATVADTRDLAAMTAAVDEGVAQLGHIDIVIANAGIASFAPAAEMDEQTWRDMIDINLTGVFFSIRPALPHLIRQGTGGSIIITSSTAGLKGMLNIPHYSAAKHGLVGLMRSLANEMAPHHVRVNTVHPTNVDTDMIQNAATRGVFGGGSDLTREQFAEAATPMNMLPVPWVDPVDISNAIVFLASDEARYITAVALPVDAGATQK
jgi:SDR family mycofactocin-dependent oxidoreductase